MDDPHGASGARLPTESARQVLALGLMWLSALVGTARADGPGVLRPLPPVTEATGASYETPLVLSATSPSGAWPSFVENPAGATFLYGFETTDPAGTFSAQPAGYVSSDAAASQEVPSVAVRTTRSLLNFAGMQDASAPEQKKEEGAAGESNEEGANAQNQGAAGGQQGQNQQEQTYGQAPVDNSLQFLRDVDVLLKPGAWQFDTGFVYTLFVNDFPLPLFDGGGVITSVIEAETRRRLLYTPLALRYGWSKNVQLFASLPAGFSNTQFSAFGLSETRNVSGIGDLTAGASIHLIKGEDQMPDLIGTIGFTAPTGKFDTPLFGLVPGSNLGQGFWALAGQGLFIHRYDPVIVFYGGGYRHLFEREFEGVPFAPGEQINYMFGVGFSVNDRVTFSTTLQGYYITNTFINDVNVRGSNLEPISMRFATTIVRNCRILEPFAQIGVTESAPRINVGIVITFY
jgi:hypothetical protein